MVKVDFKIMYIAFSFNLQIFLLVAGTENTRSGSGGSLH